jgi:membrane-associated phospholipid phosphatase
VSMFTFDSWCSWFGLTGSLGSGYGMPSSHAQFMGYFFAFSTLYLCTRYHDIWLLQAVTFGVLTCI